MQGLPHARVLTQESLTVILDPVQHLIKEVGDERKDEEEEAKGPQEGSCRQNEPHQTTKPQQ